MFPAYDPVCVLLEKPFSRWTNEDKKDFLNSNRPSPELSVYKTAKSKDRVFTRKFRNEWYSDHKWLCGSYYLNKLFCLPCLIICVKTNVWNKDGFNDFGNVTRGLHKHESTSEHIRCAIGFSDMKKELNTIKDAFQKNSRLYIKQFNENVQLNRRFMHLPIRTVLYLSKQELPFRGRIEDESSKNRGNFKELLDAFVLTSPVDIQQHYKKISSEFAANSKSIQNELIDCISLYIDEHVEKEIRECSFFSIQVDDTTDFAQKSQCSIIFRYVNAEGKLSERFMGFYDVSANRTSTDDVVLGCLGKYDFKNKLIAQCFDGASVMSGQLNGLQSKIKQIAPQAFFVHCLSQPLNSVLQQSCKYISECRIFFANVSSLTTFLKRIPTTATTRWTSNSKILSVINTEWDFLKQVFTEILNNPISDQTSTRQSQDFLNLFNNFEFALLAGINNEIFPLLDILSDVLQKKSSDINYCISQIKNTQTLLNSKRNDNVFRNIFDAASLKITVPSDYTRVTLSLTQDKLFQKYKVLFYEILDTISMQIDIRFQDLEKIRFVTLVDTTKFSMYFANFPQESLNNLKECYPDIFTDVQRLKNELQFIFGDKKYRGMEQQMFMDELFDHRDTFREAYKLFSLIVTIPSTSISVEPSFSCSKRVETYLRNTMSQERLTNLAKISIEKVFLNELINTQPFYDDIIDKFASLKERKIDLIFNNVLKEDMQNYMCYSLMKNVKIKMKPGVVPHIFDCQKTENLEQPTNQGDLIKKRRKRDLKEASARTQFSLPDSVSATASTNSRLEVPIHGRSGQGAESSDTLLELPSTSSRPATKRRRTNIDSYEDDSTSDSSKPKEVPIDDPKTSSQIQCQSDENMSDSDSLLDIIKNEIDDYIPEDVPENVSTQEVQTVMNTNNDDSVSTHSIKAISIKEEPKEQNEFDGRHPVDVFCKSVALSLKSLRRDLCNEGKVRIMQLISELEHRNSLPDDGPSTSKSSDNYSEPTSTVTRVPKKEFD